MTFLAVLIFILVYVCIISDKVHRTIAAVLGSMLMIFLHLLPQQKAFAYVDWNVIFLLIGMMIIVSVVGETGILQYIAIKSAKAARGDPYKIMVYLIFITALFSAFLDNVTTVVVIAPISVLIAHNLGITPIPFLIAEALASNIGGTATLIGDPPNIMIGSAAHISFISFMANMMPPVLLMLAVFPYLVKVLTREKLQVSYEKKAVIMEFDAEKLIQNKRLLKVTMIVFFFVILGFFIHEYIDIEVAVIAMLGAFVLMLFLPDQKNTLRKMFSQVEWPALFFLIGFFIIVGALEETGVINHIAKYLVFIFQNNLLKASFITLWFSGLVSAVFDNIPFVATMIPIVKDVSGHMALPAVNPLWWSLSLGACLGGNITLIGAAANVVISDISEKNGYSINFLQFMKYGIVITLVNLLIASAYIWIRYFLFAA